MTFFLSDAAFSSDSSSPENIEDSGLDSPSNQTLGPSPEPTGWAAWPPVSQSKDQTQTRGQTFDPFFSAFRDPCSGRSSHSQEDPTSVWSAASSHSSRGHPELDPSSVQFPPFSQSLPPPEMESSVWNCKHIPPEDPFLAAFERTVTQETLNLSDAWTCPPPRSNQEGRGTEVRGDPFSVSLTDTKTLSTSSSLSSSSSRKGRDKKRDRSLPPPISTDDPFAITMIGSPTHQSSLAAAAGLNPPLVNNNNSSSNNVAGGSANNSRLGFDSSSSSLPSAHTKKELVHWNSLHNPFTEGVSGAQSGSKTQEGGGKGEGGAGGGGERRKHRSSESEPRRNAPPLTRHSGPQEDLCFSTDKDQDCLDLNTQMPCSLSSHKGMTSNRQHCCCFEIFA